MADSDEQADVIRPQVSPENAVLPVKPVVDEEAEKKRRIDEALARYDARTHSTGVVITPIGSKPQQDSAQPTPSIRSDDTKMNQRKSERQFVVEHAAEAFAMLKPKHEGVMSPESTRQVVAPTQIDPDAAIVAAAAFANEQKKAAEAGIEAERLRQNKYAYIPENPLQTIDKKDRKTYVILIVLWIFAVPLAILITKTEAKIWGDDVSVLLSALLTTTEYLIGLYGAFGWIPLMLFYIHKHKG